MKRPFNVASASNRNQTSRIPRWLAVILGVPLEMKLVGANLVVVAVAALLLFGPAHLQTTAMDDAYIAITGLIVSAIVNFLLVRLALGPVGALEQVANRVSGGRIAASRVPGSIVADHELARLSATINEMLDSLSANRIRMEQLSAEAIYARETERVRVARELHESIGQMLATATFQLDTLAFEMGNSKTSTRLAQVRQLLRSASDEIRNVSQSVHPRNAADLAPSASTQGLPDSDRSGGASFDRRGLPTRHDMQYIDMGSPGTGLP
jgi:signal transduction histidine kinase